MCCMCLVFYFLISVLYLISAPMMVNNLIVVNCASLFLQNMEKTVLRPTAFKPVIPKNRTSMQYLSPRHCANASESQNNLNLLSPTHREVSPSSNEKCNLYSRVRSSGGGSSQSCQMSDSERTSLSGLPPYSTAGYTQTSGEASVGHLEPMKSAPPVSGHGHSNSDSGRSSSKSTGSGSLSGRGQPLSDSGSSGRSPGPVEGYEGVVRDLEDKLRERELELQQLRENLDENEAAICQVGKTHSSVSFFPPTIFCNCKISACVFQNQNLFLIFKSRTVGKFDTVGLCLLQVYEEKQKRFELELEELRQGCATRMQVASQKAQRAQQVLQLQVRTSDVTSTNTVEDQKMSFQSHRSLFLKKRFT